MAKSTLKFPLFLVLICFILALYRVEALGGKVGGWREIPNAKSDPEIQELGRYSVAEFNKSPRKYAQKSGNGAGGVGVPVTFSAVVEAESQVVAGIKYHLKISGVSSSGVPKMFDAYVVVQAWKKPQKQLLNFSPSPPPQ